MLYLWKLYPEPPNENGAGGETNPVMSYNRNKISFSSIAVFKSHDQKESKEPIIYVTGSDRIIREIKDGEESLRYEENVTYSQILCGYMRRILVAGVSENDRPGSL